MEKEVILIYRRWLEFEQAFCVGSHIACMNSLYYNGVLG